ncbi:small-subunit processome [Amylostereum chailletii]|nr:small-subunit processome [Amylostereum chailletii]
MTSSLRNSLHRRNHKERSQLAHRSRLGILEKHKDYVLRARDYHSKQDRITRLKQKAADRNKDEFYFAMNRQKTKGGVHVQDKWNVALPVDMVKILKSQDENYIRTMRTAGLKKIEKLKGQLSAMADLLTPGSIDAEDAGDTLEEEELKTLREAGVIAGPSSSRKKGSKSAAKHIIFAETEDEAREYAASRKANDRRGEGAMDVDVPTVDDLGWKSPDDGKNKNKGKGKAKGGGSAVALASAESERQQASATNRTRLLKELSARLHRDRMLRYAERELEMQKLLMGKGGSKKIKGLEKVENEEDEEDEDEDRPQRKNKGAKDEKFYKPRVFKWRAERKR